MVAIVSPHGVNQVVQDRRADVAPSGVHGGYLPPGLPDRVEAPAGIEVIHAVEASDDVDLEAHHRGAVVSSRSRRIHLLDFDPPVGTGVVSLDEVGGRTAGPAADGEEHLVGNSGTGYLGSHHFTISRKPNC